MLVRYWRYRGLVFELTKREFSGRYRGSFGGALWSFVQPLLLLAVYTIFFGVFLATRWGGTGGTVEYAFILFAGLIVFNAFAECLGRAPTLITAHPGYVKKVVFPLELLPCVSALTALFNALISVVVWFIGYILLFGAPKPTASLLPLVLLCFLPVLLGIGWLVSAVGVLVRDVNQLTGIVSHVLLFLTPIFYSPDIVPEPLRALLLINPLTFVVEQARDVLFFGRLPDVPGLAAYFLLSSLFAGISFLLFQRLRPVFADLV